MYIVIVRSPEILPTTLRIKLCICVCIPQTTKIYYLLGCNGPWQATYNNNYCSFRPANRPWLNTFVCFPHISFIFSSFYSLYISVCMCVCVHVCNGNIIYHIIIVEIVNNPYYIIIMHIFIMYTFSFSGEQKGFFTVNFRTPVRYTLCGHRIIILYEPFAPE